MNGNAIQQAASAHVTGNLIVGGTASVTGQASVAGGVAVTGGNVTVSAGGVTANTATIAGNAQIGGNATVVGTTSTTSATVAQDLTLSSLPYAQQNLRYLAPKLVEVGSQVVQDTSYGNQTYPDGVYVAGGINKPTCGPSQVPRVFIIPQNATGPVIAGRWGYQIYATDQGTWWAAMMRDVNGDPLPQTNDGAFYAPQRALMRSFCETL